MQDTTAITNNEAEAGRNLSGMTEMPQETALKTQARAHHTHLICELKRVAGMSSTDFWIWWWSPEKTDRLVLLEKMEPVQVGRG